MSAERVDRLVPRLDAVEVQAASMFGEIGDLCEALAGRGLIDDATAAAARERCAAGAAKLRRYATA